MKPPGIIVRRSIWLSASLITAIALAWFVLPFAVPLPASLAGNPQASPVFLDREGRPIAHLTLTDSTRSTPVSLDEIPEDLIACTLSAEDKRFFNHGGLDLLATGRAAFQLVKKRRVVSGASTITQQLVKISSPAASRNLATKAREALLARRLEMTWDKRRILMAYLNRLDYGNRRTGPAEACRFYFQKPLVDLSLAECALLSGLPQAPSRLNPLVHPQRALKRRTTVLQRLEKNRSSSGERVRRAYTEPLTLRPLREKSTAPWLPAVMPGPRHAMLTTLDLSLQQSVEAIVRTETLKLKAANLRHAAVVVIHNPTGEVLTLVSSADWADRRGGQINGALTPRSPGSTLKPFTYLLAMEKNGQLPCSILADIATPFRTPQGLNLPENYDRTFRGPVTLRHALACSLNLPALRELQAMGGPAPLADLLQELGISTLGNDPSVYGIGLTLGNAPVRLLELTNAYATLARAGRHLPVRLFLDHPPGTPAKSLPFQQSSFYLLADILADGKARAPSFAPGGPLDLPFPCAVKTGTSSDFRDNWCIGFTPQFTVGVWAGNFERDPMKGISGIAGAGPIFHRTMIELHRTRRPEWFERPEDLQDIVIDLRTGKRLEAEDLATRHQHSARSDMAPATRMPPLATRADYDPEGKALLQPVFEEWFHGSHNQRHQEFALDQNARALEPLRISVPANDAVFLLDPEIPSGSRSLRPVTNLPGILDWHSDTLEIHPSQPEPVILLTVGSHILTATDRRSGQAHTIRIHVKSL